MSSPLKVPSREDSKTRSPSPAKARSASVLTREERQDARRRGAKQDAMEELSTLKNGFAESLLVASTSTQTLQDLADEAPSMLDPTLVRPRPTTSQAKALEVDSTATLAAKSVVRKESKQPSRSAEETVDSGPAKSKSRSVTATVELMAPDVNPPAIIASQPITVAQSPSISEQEVFEKDEVETDVSTAPLVKTNDRKRKQPEPMPPVAGPSHSRSAAVSSSQSANKASAASVTPGFIEDAAEGNDVDQPRASKKVKTQSKPTVPKKTVDKETKFSEKAKGKRKIVESEEDEPEIANPVPKRAKTSKPKIKAATPSFEADVLVQTCEDFVLQATNDVANDEKWDKTTRQIIKKALSDFAVKAKDELVLRQDAPTRKSKKAATEKDVEKLRKELREVNAGRESVAKEMRKEEKLWYASRQRQKVVCHLHDYASRLRAALHSASGDAALDLTAMHHHLMRLSGKDESPDAPGNSLADRLQQFNEALSSL